MFGANVESFFVSVLGPCEHGDLDEILSNTGGAGFLYLHWLSGCLVETETVGDVWQWQRIIIAFNIFWIKWSFVVVVAGVTADMFCVILCLNKL